MADLTNQFLIGVSLDLKAVQTQFAELNKLVTQLKAQYQAAFTSSTSAFSPNIKGVQQSNVVMSEHARLVKDVARRQREALASGDKMNNSIKGINQSLGDTARRVFVWGALSAGIFGTIAALKEAYDFTIKINTAMAELRKVLPAEEDFAGIQSRAFKLSIDFGRAPEEAFDILTRFGQAGLTTAQALQATKTALLALNTTGADTEQVVNALISSARIFGTEWGNMVNVIDKIQKVQADFAISAKDLIVSISTIGPAVQVVNGDINDLFAVIAGMGEAARVSGKEASNALKTIFARIGTEEGIAALQKLGIAVFDVAGQFRPIRDIMGELADRLEIATDHEKQLAAVQLGGVRQYSKLLAALINYEQVHRALSASEESYGEALQANAAMMDSYERRLGSISAANKKAMTEIFDKLDVNEGVIGLAQGFNALLTGLNQLPSAFITATVTATAMFGALKLGTFVFIKDADIRRTLTFTRLMSFMKNGLDGQQASWAANTKGLENFNSHLIKTGKSIRFFRLALGASLIFPAVLIGVGLLWERIARGDKIVQNATDRLKTFKETLSDLNFNEVFPTDLEAKFSAISDLFIKLGKLGGAGELNITTALKEASEVFSDISTDETEANVKKFQDIYDNFIKFVIKQKSAPIIEALTPVQQGVTSINNIITEGLSTGQIKSDNLNGFELNLADAISKSLTKVQDKVLDNQSGLDFVGGWFKKLFNKGETLEAAETVASLVIEMTKLADAARDAAGNPIKFKDFITGTSESAQQFRDLQKAAADAFLSVVNINTLAQQAVNKAGLKLTIDSSQATSSLQVVDDLLNLVIARIKEVSTITLDDTEIKEMRKSVGEMFEQFVKGTEQTKLFIEALNEVALGTGLKKSGTPILAGYLAELGILNELETQLGRVSKAYDIANEKKKLAKSTLNSLLDEYRENAKSLQTLSLELSVLETALNKGAASVSDGVKSKLDTEELPKRIADVKQRILGLQIAQADVKKVLDETATILIEIIDLQDKLAAGPELANSIFEDNLKLLKNLTDDTAKLNQLFSKDPIKLFELDDKLQQQLLEAEKTLIDLQVKNNTLTKTEADLKKQEAERSYEINRAESAREVILKGVEERLKVQIDLAKDYASVYRDIRESIVDAALEISKLGKVRNSDNVLFDELEALEQKKQLALQELRSNETLSRTLRENLEFEERSIEIKYEGLKAEALLNDILQSRRERYQAVQQTVDNIKGSISSWLSDQNQLFDDLQSKGSIFQALGRGASGIAGAIAKADADAIADALTGKLNNFVTAVQGGIKVGFAEATVTLSDQLRTSLENISLPKDLEESINSSSEAFISGTYSTILAAWQAVAQTYFPMLNQAIQAGFQQKDFAFELASVDMTRLTELTKELSRVTGVNQTALIDRIMRSLVSDRALQQKQIKEAEEKGQVGAFKPAANIGGFGAAFTSFGDGLEVQDKSTQAEVQLLSVSLNESMQAMADEVIKGNKTFEEFNVAINSLYGIIDTSMIPVLKTGLGKSSPMSDLSRTAEEIRQEEEEQRKKMLTNAAIRQIGSFITTGITSALAKSTGASAERVGFGSSIGSTALGVLSNGNPFLSAAGGFIGGIFGALTGSDKEDEQIKELTKIEKNTAQLVERLSPEIINAPVGFSIPSGVSTGGAIMINNNITVTGGAISSSDTDKLTRQLESIYSRSSRNTSITR